MSKSSTLTNAAHGRIGMGSMRIAARRILIVAPSLRIMGGQAVQAAQLLSKLRKEGVCADLLPIDPTPPRALRHAVKVKYVRTIVNSYFYISALIRHIPRYDVIHIFSASYFSFILAPTPALLIAKFYGKPSILNYRSGEADDHLGRWGKMVAPIIRLSSRIVVPSEYLVEIFRAHGFSATAIPNFVDEVTITFHERTSAQPRIIVARALEPIYNVACAISAFALVQEKYPRAEMVILGSGSEDARLRDLVASRRLTGVSFTGRVERDAISRHYDWADIFLNSSSIDNMPVSILEAFAAGLPVVTTDAGGIPFIITDKVNGRLVPVDDSVALAEAVIELVQNPGEVHRLSRQGSETIKRYRWRTVSGKWLAIYNELVEELSKDSKNTPAASVATI